MAGHFRTLLEAAVAEPDRRISDLPLLTEEERRQVLVEWNATERSYPETTIHRLIEAQVRRTPDAVALTFEGRTMGYGELNRRSNQLARHLRGLGVGPDTLVGLCIERSFEMVVGLLGILKSGGAYVPVDPGYPPERQSYMIEDSRAPVLLTQANLAGGLAGSGARVVVLDAGWEEIGRYPDGDLEDGSGPGDLAYVIYTSGSTGKPKGAMNEHRAVCNRLLWMQDDLRADGVGPGAAEDAVQLRRLGVGVLLAADDGSAAGDCAPRGAQGPRLPGAADPGGGDHDPALCARRCCGCSWRQRGWRRAGSVKRVICSGEALAVRTAGAVLRVGCRGWSCTTSTGRRKRRWT